MLGRFALELARDAAPWVVYANSTWRDFFSARVGCQTFNPVYGLDLAAMAGPPFSFILDVAPDGTTYKLTGVSSGNWRVFVAADGLSMPERAPLVAWAL